MLIGSMDAGEVSRAAEDHLPFLWNHPKFPKDRHNGGYLCIASRDDGMPILIAQIRQCPMGKAQRYFQFSQEKAERLYEMNARHGHVSSWQSRDEKAEKYGGAIVAGEFIFSFSGLPEKADEFFAIKLARMSKTIGEGKKDAAYIAKLSQNEFFYE